METFLSVIFLNIALRVTVLSSPNEQSFEVSKFHIAIVILRHHHPHDKLKHSSHFFFIKRTGAFLETYPERNRYIARLYLHVYIQNGLDGSATAKSFFFSLQGPHSWSGLCAE